MTDESPDDILMTVTVAPARRAIGVGTLALLGGLLLYIPMSSAPSNALATLFLLGSGGLALLGAEMLRRATAHGIELTRSELRDTAGRVLAPLSEIRGVERGALAFKPSNGFMVQLAEPGARHWSPGLWWRLGRNVGVGGVTSAGQCKAMAETLQILLADRDKT